MSKGDEVTEPNLVEVAEEKIVGLEKDHEHLELLREKVRRIRYAESQVEDAKKDLKDAKDKLEKLNDDLVSVIEDGPAKPDPQARLPFAKEEEPDSADEGDDDFEDDDLEEPDGPVGEASAAPSQIPEVIDQLDLTKRQKEKLATTGVKTKAELVDLVNGNLPDYPKGLKDLVGFGIAASKRLVEQLPSTATDSDESAPTEVKRIVLLTFGGDKGEGKFSPGNEYEARIKDDGSAVVQLPGDDPVSFGIDEYKLAE